MAAAAAAAASDVQSHSSQGRGCEMAATSLSAEQKNRAKSESVSVHGEESRQTFSFYGPGPHIYIYRILREKEGTARLECGKTQSSSTYSREESPLTHETYATFHSFSRGYKFGASAKPQRSLATRCALKRGPFFPLLPPKTPTTPPLPHSFKFREKSLSLLPKGGGGGWLILPAFLGAREISFFIAGCGTRCYAMAEATPLIIAELSNGEGEECVDSPRGGGDALKSSFLPPLFLNSHATLL